MRPYYEGWYMKQQMGSNVLAIIPGRAQDEAFVQVISETESHYVSYPLESYNQTKNRSMRVGTSLFSPRGMMLAINEPNLTLTGRLRYHQLTPLRSNIMGPFAFLPLETKHTIFSMHHHVDGTVHMNERNISFNNGVGYMEGDRGYSFPRRYTWVQSTDFCCVASVMVALAEIPLAGFHFTGCIAVVSLAGSEYRFATYRGVHIREASPTRIELSQGDMTLHVGLPQTSGHGLQAPAQGSMVRSIHESPAVPASFRFIKNGKTLLENTCACTSYEHVAP